MSPARAGELSIPFPVGVLHTGEIDPAYLMINVFQQRNRERIAYALKLLDTEPDWTLDETLNVDREHAEVTYRSGVLTVIVPKICRPCGT